MSSRKTKIDPEADAVANGRHENPFAFLGIHQGENNQMVVRCFLPEANAVDVIDAKTGKRAAKAGKIHPGGVFEAKTKRAERFDYVLHATWGDHSEAIVDPYAFSSAFGEVDLHLLAEGNHFQSWKKLGAHLTHHEGHDGVRFSVWAPNARRVSVVGDFNFWDGRRHVMRKHPSCGVWEIFIPDIGEGMPYKYEIVGPGGEKLPLKSDPHAFHCEHPPSTASLTATYGLYQWNDRHWMESRANGANRHDAPMSIYEVHLGSWKRKPEEGGRYLSYREMADDLVPYVADMGFTHLELLPVSEFPFDGSWGYQPIGLFAPTSRFGSPDDFRYFVDKCHQAGIGVILDWVPGHFPEDEHGLGFFDGTHLYEHADPRQGRHMDWGTLIYNYDRAEVRNFLLSNALFWLDEYHIDGLRVDAVASMLYLNYSRKDGEWVPNEFGGNENLGAISFVKKLNELIYSTHPGTFTMAEESTAWPMVSRPTYLGGLGFGYKWNMGWMHDTLSYIGRDPIHREYHQDEMTFGLLYAFNENFVLPLSHDEVVHGKGSLMGRMPGDKWQKAANLRAYFGFMFTHPGKKLLFMGGEFGQHGEWNHNASLDWHLLDDPLHAGLQRLVKDLNRLYRDTPALFEGDFSPQGFEWIDCSDYRQCILSWVRRLPGNAEHVVVVCNLTPVPRQDYAVGVPHGGVYEEVLNTDAESYGGSGMGNMGAVATKAFSTHGQPHTLNLTLPPLSVTVLKLGAEG